MMYLNKAILITLGMALPLAVMASPDDVTIRMMEVNEYTTEAVTRQIELPEAFNDRAIQGMEAANRNRYSEHNDMGDYDHDYDMEREEDYEHEMDIDRDDHMDMDRDDHMDAEYNETDYETSSHDYK